MQIKLTKCEFGCFGHKSFDFFGSQDATQFIVEYRFKRTKSKRYGLLETYKTSTGGTMCTLNGEIMYNLGKDCLITGYCPIEITTNNMSKLGVVSMGLKCPIIKKNDNIADIALEVIKDYVKNNMFVIDDNDVLCITESIVARAQGNYVTIDDIVKFLETNNYKKNLVLYAPIMSRNRFSIILKGFARFANNIAIVVEDDYDEQGNPTMGINQFTGVDIRKYYTEICEAENCKLTWVDDFEYANLYPELDYIDCKCHPAKENHEHTVDNKFSYLYNIMDKLVVREDGTVSGWNENYGVLGSNKADEETLKLFPRDCNELCEEIKKKVKDWYNHDIHVLVYGDGCFKDPVGGIWEFADPVTCPGYTKGLEGTPNELKLKALADGKFGMLKGDELKEAITNEIKNKEKDLVGSMASQGTTPRRYIDLLASLADLTSGSGDKGTPMVYIKNYFDNYATEK